MDRHRSTTSSAKAPSSSDRSTAPPLAVLNTAERRSRTGAHIEVDRCTKEGRRCATCPWHGSIFDVRRLDRGRPGPAPQPAYEVRFSAADQVEIRRSEQGALRLNPVR